MTIAAAIDWLNTQLITISGIDVAAIPGDNIGVNGLIAMAYDASGVLTSDADHQGRDLSTIRVLLIYPRSDLRQAIVALSGKPQEVADKIRTDPTFSGTVSTFESITYALTVIPWQAVDCIGYQIDIAGVKIRSVIA